MSTKKAPTVRAFLARSLAIPLLLLWLLSQLLLTWAVARDFYLQLESSARDAVSAADYRHREPDGLPGWAEYQMLSNLGMPYLLVGAEPLLPIALPQSPSSLSPDDPFWGNWDLLYGHQSAIAYHTPQGEPILQSGDYLYFPYAYTRKGAPVGYGYIDLSDLEGGEDLIGNYLSGYPFGDMFPFLGQDIRLTGSLEGARFIPTQIDILWSSGADTVYSAESAQETITVYAQMQGYHVSPAPVTAGGKRYETITALLLSDEPPTGFRLTNAVIRAAYSMDDAGYISLVVHCNPLRYAMVRLLPACLISAGLLFLVLWLLLKRIRKKLTEPLSLINRGYETNRTQLSGYADFPLAELEALKEHFNTAQQLRHAAENEVTQLQTAIHYARNAEENRRKLVSSMAHELKTPLSVIHGYAEGLQEGIAADKQQKYLSVILDETEQMDAIVLGMLDLSRLEAGRVQLRTEQFSLLSLTEEVLDTLELSAGEKNLEILLPIREEFTVTADRARIRQVVVNLVSNAIRYTPEGGRITIRIAQWGGMAQFSIENDAEPLRDEVLSQIWDSFYRADRSHSGRGSGLGLAIVKAVVELHRGRCSVQNTPSGVEFRFELPA